jgi:hypothetical protein
LWQLILGARDMAFPPLNALSCWVFLFAGIFLYSSFPFGQAPNAGWFNYVPLSGLEYNTGPNIDIYALGMVLLGASTTVGPANFVVTFIRMRAPGISIDRVPVLVWGTLTASGRNPTCSTAAGRSSGKTCSGCSPIRGSTPCASRHGHCFVSGQVKAGVEGVFSALLRRWSPFPRRTRHIGRRAFSKWCL